MNTRSDVKFYNTPKHQFENSVKIVVKVTSFYLIAIAYIFYRNWFMIELF